MIVKSSTRKQEIEDFDLAWPHDRQDALRPSERADLHAHRRGMEGERESAFYLDRDFAHSDDHALIHDLRLPDGLGGFAQFDHILLSRLSRTATIFEVKHFSGRLSKNDHGEWMVWYNTSNRPIDISSPVEQVRRQSVVLGRWLADHGHDQAFARIGCFVVVPPKCAIDRKRITQAEPVVKADNIYRRWLPFGGCSPFGRLFSTGIGAAALHDVARQLAAAHVPGGVPHVLQRWGTRDFVQPDGRPRDVPSAGPDVEPVANSEIGPPPMALAPRAEPESKREKAGPLVRFAPGIEHRALPHGDVALRAAKGDALAATRLADACAGRAKWHPRYSNWITTAEGAEQIRTILLKTNPTIGA